MTGSDENVVIRIDNVRKYFREVRAVDGIDLSLARGEFLALLGPNGAGKTTLIEMIEGLQEPDSGRIGIMGKSWKHHQSVLHRQIGISLQETRFIDKLTTRETLRLFSSFYGLGPERIEEVLQLIRLDEKKKSYVVNLSGGQRQRLALGIALLNAPSILLLDEPTTGLDPNSRREIWEILMSQKKQNKTTMILTTHYMEEASYLCDRIVILDKGRILAGGTLEELLSEYMSEEVIEFSVDGDVSDLRLEGMPWFRSLTRDEERRKARLFVSEITEALPDVLRNAENAQVRITGLECRRMTLDDLFVSLTGRRLND